MQIPQTALQPLIGLSLGILVAFLAWRAGALSRSGAAAAALTGGLIFGLGGIPWAVLLLTFFVSSSALSRLFARRKAALNEKFSKGSRRDWGQVAANGGLGALLVIAQTLLPEQSWPWIAFAGAMAAVNADTWATEIGVLSKTAPRLITTGKQVERGESGAISRLGSLAALGGAALVALFAALFTGMALPGAPALFIAITALLGGVSGSFFDSLLGATLQAIYTCPACQKQTERHPFHTCGTPTIPFRGWRWLDNDLVNFLASLVGALLAVGISLLVV
jgi:uncharacterized protein (TIGR00297 family)